MKKHIGFLSFFLIVIDQITKFLVVKFMDLNQSIKIIGNFFHITYITNSGAAFGILKNSRIFFIIISCIAVFLVVKYVIEEKKVNKYDVVCYSLILSGIIGNLIDRIVYKNVVDFMDFKFFSYNFYIFNFADMCIVVGVVLMLYKLYKGDEVEKKSSRRVKSKNR